MDFTTKTFVGKSDSSIEDAIRDAEAQAETYLGQLDPSASAVMHSVQTRPYTTGPGGIHVITYVITYVVVLMDQ